MDPGIMQNRLGNTRYWTRVRVVVGLKEAMRLIEGPLPCGDRNYNRMKKGHYDWPTSHRILEYFGSIAHGWLAAGAPMDRVTMRNLDWTEEETEHLMTFAGETSLENIARQLGRSYYAVKSALHCHGITARANQGLFSAAEISRHYGCSYTRVQNLLARGVLVGEYDTLRHRWQVDIQELPTSVEAILLAPKQTHKAVPTDVGGYYRRHGLCRRNGRVQKRA